VRAWHGKVTKGAQGAELIDSLHPRLFMARHTQLQAHTLESLDRNANWIGNRFFVC